MIKLTKITKKNRNFFIVFRTGFAFSSENLPEKEEKFDFFDQTHYKDRPYFL